MAAPRYLADTNILVRLAKRHDPECSLVRGALRALLVQSARLCYTPQTMAECWHVSTRPPERHGDGLTPLEADRRARRIERAFMWLPDSEAVSREWRRLIVAHAAAGVQVYDARLVAVMKGHDVIHLLTLNDRDVARYAGITDVRDFKCYGFSGTTGASSGRIPLRPSPWPTRATSSSQGCSTAPRSTGPGPRPRCGVRRSRRRRYLSMPSR
jgi:predicted nucleic acid-binding protein